MRILLICALLFSFSVMVQGQGFQRRTVEERTKRVTDTLTTIFKLEKNVQDQANTIFTEYYKASDKMREGLAEGERPDRAQIDKLITERDEKLKKVLTEDQFKKFKDEIEPALRPRRRQG